MREAAGDLAAGLAAAILFEAFFLSQVFLRQVFLRYRVGRAQIKRAGQCGVGTDRGAQPCHPGNIRRRLHLDLERRRRIGRPAVAENFGGVADQMCCAKSRRAERLLDRGDARPDQRAAIAAHHLKIHLAVPRIDGGDHRLLRVPADDGCGIGRQRGQPDHGFLGREPDAARGRQPNPQSGKAAGAGGRRDAVERSERDAGLLDDARDQRHQGLGMAAFHRLQFLRDHPGRVGVEHGSGAGIQRGVDGEDQHGGVYSRPTIATSHVVMTGFCFTLPWRGRVDATERSGGVGWQSLALNSVRVEGPSPHPVSHLASRDASRPSPSRGG